LPSSPTTSQALSAPIRLILDDVHELGDPQVLHGVQSFMRAKPATVQLVLSSRFALVMLAQSELLRCAAADAKRLAADALAPRPGGVVTTAVAVLFAGGPRHRHLRSGGSRCRAGVMPCRARRWSEEPQLFRPPDGVASTVGTEFAVDRALVGFTVFTDTYSSFAISALDRVLAR
jgi:hypothetical protein